MKPNWELFEVSYEVCNKVGGIYAVITSKAKLVKEAYGDGYTCIGPYYEDKARIELEPLTPPPDLAQVFSELEREGVICHYGKWLIEGEPIAILVQPTDRFAHRLDEFKTLYWEAAQVESMFAGQDFNEPLLWSTAVGILLEKIRAIRGHRFVGHFHEWLSGFGLLYLKAKQIDVGTVFTTHATILGRTIAACGEDLYERLPHINPYEEAKQKGILDKYTAEKACAKRADSFTTVSDITGIEAEKLLERKPDVLVYNGLDKTSFPTFEESSIEHKEFRDEIRKFVSYYFFPHYHFDLDQTLLFFLLGRFELRNKGIDLTIQALGRLNKELKAANSEKTIIMFVWVPAMTYGIKEELIKRKMLFVEMEDTIREALPQLSATMLDNTLSLSEEEVYNEEKMKGLIHKNTLDHDFMLAMKKLELNFKSKQPKALLTTHNLENEGANEILRMCIANGLDNSAEARVKIVYYPVYLNGVDGLLDLPLYDCIQGCHLGLFPSYYEPWGYTPMEAALLGVPAVTSDLSGCGLYLNKASPSKDGVWVVPRRNKPWSEQLDAMTKVLSDFTHLHRADRVAQKIKAKQKGDLVDWSIFVPHYIEAQELAFRKQR
ncbi:MAG: glycosyltransferase [Candidatus Woesearchaeota archaeon]|nr:MAG: glycosyltransferase [Candidatus Woesearchaeota archaeon]